MKKNPFVVLFLLLAAFKSYAQNVNKNDSLSFDPMHYNNYIGKKIVVNKDNYSHSQPKVILGFTYSFEHDILTDNRVVYPVTTGDYPNITSYRDSLTNKVFTCTGVVETGFPLHKPYLRLYNPKTGTIYCAIAESESDITTVDEVEKAKAEENQKIKERQLKRAEDEKELHDPCSQIDYEYDEFHYTKKFTTAMKLPDLIADTVRYKFFDAVFLKNISKNGTSYYVSLQTTAGTPLATERGVIIILNDGKRINKPQAEVTTDVETVYSEATYMRHAFIRLNENDLALLKKSPIKEFELYIDQHPLDHADLVYQMFLCLFSKK